MICYNLEKPPYKEREEIDFVCSSCVQKLLRFTQSDLLKGYRIAKDKGYSSKMEALSMFLDEKTRMEAEGNGKRKFGQSVNGKRPMRIFGHEQKPDRKFKEKGFALREAVSKSPALFRG